MKKILVLILAALLISFATIPAMAVEPVASIKIGLQSKQGPMTPYSDITTKNWEVLGLVYDCLYELNTQRVPRPNLATSYTVSNDFKTYTFTLRDDVKWHDGVSFTAEDVKFCYELLADKVYSINFTNPCKNIAQINIPDPYTVEFVLAEARSEEIIENLFAYMPIAPKHIYEGLTDTQIMQDDLRIGTGPYIITDMERDNYYTLKANQDYFAGEPTADELVLIVIEDATAAYAAIQSKQIDVLMRSLTPELIDQFKGDSSLKVIEGSGFTSCMAFMNEYRYPFSEKDFRQAVVSALDIEDITNTVMLGFATVGSPGFVHPEYHLYNPATPKYKQDVAKAKELLDNLKFIDTDGNGIREDETGKPLSFEILVYASRPQMIRVAEITKEQLAAVGIELTVNALEGTVVDSLVAPNWDAVEPGEFDMALWGWGDVFMSTPSRYVEQFHSDPAVAPSNLTRINEPEMDAIMEGIRDAIDISVRNGFVDQMQLFLADQNTLIMYYYNNVAYVYNPSVYDNWVLTLGKSIVNKSSLVDLSGGAVPVSEAPATGTTAPEQSAAPSNTPAASDTAPVPVQESKSPILYIALGIVVVIVIVAFILRKKKK